MKAESIRKLRSMLHCTLAVQRSSFVASPGPSLTGCKAAWRYARLFLSLLSRIVLFTSRRLACRFLCRSAQHQSAVFGRCRPGHSSLMCARRTWDKTSVVKGLHSGRHCRYLLILQKASGGLDRAARRWRNARKRAAAKAGQPGVKGSVGCGGTRRCYGSLLVTCRRSSVCSRLLRSIRRLPLQPQQR